MIADYFRQIVWKETNQIGLTFRDQGTTYIVLAVYYPSGNIPGTYADNVNPPINSQPANDPEIGLIYQTGDYIYLQKNVNMCAVFWFVVNCFINKI